MDCFAAMALAEQHLAACKQAEVEILDSLDQLPRPLVLNDTKYEELLRLFDVARLNVVDAEDTLQRAKRDVIDAKDTLEQAERDMIDAEETRQQAAKDCKETKTRSIDGFPGVRICF